jgi:glycerophosphoryl diester phosphodiesterase
MVAIREKYPEQRAQFLTSTFTDDLIDRLKAYNLDLDINYKALTADIVKQIKAEGIFLNCWTVDDPAIATQLINWGVDYITTNILE